MFTENSKTQKLKKHHRPLALPYPLWVTPFEAPQRVGPEALTDGTPPVGPSNMARAWSSGAGSHRANASVGDDERNGSG